MTKVYIKGHFSDVKRKRIDLSNTAEFEYVMTVKNTKEELDAKKYLNQHNIKFYYNKLLKTFSVRPNSEKQEQLIEMYTKG